MKTIITAVLLILAATAAFAQCQSNRLTVKEELHDSASAIVGTVQSAQFIPESSEHVDGVRYTVHIDRLIHGKTASQNASQDAVIIFSENDTAKFPMQIGKQYLLFVHDDHGTATIDNCGNSGLLQASAFENANQLKQYARNN
ncbi:MAG: hypothetical protein ACR2JE_09745 [Acidobacteriaceae bacterium]